MSGEGAAPPPAGANTAAAEPVGPIVLMPLDLMVETTFGSAASITVSMAAMAAVVPFTKKAVAPIFPPVAT